MKPVTKFVTPDGEAHGPSFIAELRSRKTALRPKELAALLAISERQVTALVKAGLLPASRSAAVCASIRQSLHHGYSNDKPLRTQQKTPPAPSIYSFE